ncbi:MAG: hypothetical protein ACP5QA_08910, partial [Phycisphaerae bacterium]
METRIAERTDQLRSYWAILDSGFWILKQRRWHCASKLLSGAPHRASLRRIRDKVRALTAPDRNCV